MLYIGRPINIFFMWEIQSDWTQLNKFYVKIGDNRYELKYLNGMTECDDKSVEIQNYQNRSFSTTTKEGTCTFLSPKRTLDIHKGESINCVAISGDKKEVLSGDRSGHLLLTHLGTEPIPLPGPTVDFDIEYCCFDKKDNLWFACGGDFRIYMYSATEYQQTGTFVGHHSAVTCVQVYEDKLYSASRDSLICVWDIAKNKKLSSANMHSPVNDICFTNNGLIYAATENSIRAIDQKTQQGVTSPSVEKGLSFNTIASYGNEVVVGTDNGDIISYDLRNTTNLLDEWSWYDSPINKVRFNGDKLWATTNDGTAACINLHEKQFNTILGTTSYVPIRDIAINDYTIWTASGEGILSNFEF